MHFVVLLSALVACAAGAALNPTKPKQEGRIFKGEEARITDFPYQAFLMGRGKYRGGAVIIDNNWALTAAHCVYGFTAERLLVWTGRESLTCGGSPRMVREVIRHEKNFGNTTLAYDIALLKLYSNINSTRHISLRTTAVPVGTTAVVTGWGYTSNTSSFSNTLQQGTVTIIDPQECRDAYANLTSDDTILCARDGPKGQSTCAGDSGGALVYDKQLIGLVSGGGDCGDPNDPRVFISIPALWGWIRSTVDSN
uniref:Serine protease n=1 Tax=Coptotermes formosanus TaxID=36987 RepID=R4UXD2_COPFO|nr:serine protease [Coptotermes formosanus]